jgi:hypothetical protein
MRVARCMRSKNTADERASKPAPSRIWSPTRSASRSWSRVKLSMFCTPAAVPKPTAAEATSGFDRAASIATASAAMDMTALLFCCAMMRAMWRCVTCAISCAITLASSDSLWAARRSPVWTPT